MKACFMGLGYIGLPTAIIAAKHGVQIVGVDINPKVVEMTNQGCLHIIEPGMEQLLQENFLKNYGKEADSDLVHVLAEMKLQGYTQLLNKDYSHE